MTFDTGAGESVAGKESFPESEIRKTMMSENGGYYVAANNQKIWNEGEMTVKGQDKNFQDRGIIFQVAKVTKPLFAGAQAARMGFRTILEEDSEGNNVSYMLHKASGQVTPIDMIDGVYCFDLWVEDVKESGFTRPGTP